jgi:hypothetical protein
VFSSPPHRCAVAHVKSTAPGVSPKTAAHAGALGLARGAPEPAAIDAELGPSHPPTPAAIVARRRPTVSKLGSSRHSNTVGENLIENRGLEHRIRPTPVSHQHGPVPLPTGAPPPGQSRSSPSVLRSTVEIRSRINVHLV